MNEIRISEIAKETGLNNKEVLEKALELGIKAKNGNSGITEQEATELFDYIISGNIKKEKPKKSSSKKQINKKESAKDIKEVKPKEVLEQLVKQEVLEQKEKIPKADTSKTISTNSTQVQKPQVEEEKQTKEEETLKQTLPKAKTKEEIKKTRLQEAKAKIVKGDSLAQANLKKMRGLVFVKKKKKKEVEPKPADLKEITKIQTPLENIFSDFDDKLDSKRKKKKEKKHVVSKKDNVEKIDIFAEKDIGMFENPIEEEMVILPDFTTKLEPENKEEPKRKSTINANYANANANQTKPRSIKRKKIQKYKKPNDKNTNEQITSVEISDEIRVYEFAEKLNKQSSEIITKLFMLGLMVTKNDFLDKDAIEILADEFQVEVNITNAQKDFDYIELYENEKNTKEEERAPVVTIMGHVDHGKTSLLDYIRNSRVAIGEAGGITQHVGAYMVNKNGKNITFIDTPGHEAFTQMRARGAEVTDIVIIVVAADDGVKPQTKEAINHAKAAKVPIIVAINKMDKKGANPDKVKTELSELNIMPTEWGGEHEFVEISAKEGDGIEDLLEIILLQAEILELKADPSRFAKAAVIESSLEKGRGSVATVVIQNGTLRVGDNIVAGIASGKIRALLNDKGENLQSAKPGEPCVIVGLNEVPNAGETLIQVQNDKIAREYAQKRYEYLRAKELSKSTKVTIEELSDKIAEGEIKNLPLIIKADVQGSLEAIKGSLEKLNNEETKVNIIHTGVGGISESDISLASASEHSVIIGFNIRPTGAIKEKAKNLGVEIKTYKVIFNLIDDVKALLSGMMAPIIREENLGQAEVRDTFSVPKVGMIAGCMVTDGVINRGASIRLIREGVIIYESSVSSLKRFKDDVKEVAKGYECGIGIENFNDIKIGDFIESFVTIEEKVSL